MTEVKRTVSHSEVDSYLRCELAHFYGYGMRLQRRKTSDAMHRGTLGHEVLEDYHEALVESDYDYEASAKVGRAKAIDLMATDPLAAELLEPVLIPLNYYFDEWMPAKQFKILHFEQDFLLEVTADLDTPIIPDLIVQDRWGRIGVMDSKFTYDFYTQQQLALMPQIPKYSAVLRATGTPVAWGGYIFFRYRGRKDDTAADRFKFSELEMSDSRVRQTFTEQYVASERIQALKRLPLSEWKGQVLRAFNEKVCQMCSFRSLCDTELNDPSQAQSVLDMEYQVREQRVFTDGKRSESST